MIGRHCLLDGVRLDVTTRANEKVRLQLTHELFEPDMGNMTPQTARQIAADLIIAADIIEANASPIQDGSLQQAARVEEKIKQMGKEVMSPDEFDDFIFSQSCRRI